MRNKRYLSFLLVLTLLLTLFTASCGKQDTTSESGGDSKKTTAGGTFNMALSGDIVKLDPAFTYDATGLPVINQIVEGLLQFEMKGETMVLAPCLAERWEKVSPTEYVYYLRQGVQFQDGTPMNAKDVVFSYERMMDPDTGAYAAWMFDNVASVTATDDYTVKVNLTQPDGVWQYVPATAGKVVSKAYYEAHADNFGTPEGGLLGTGPYKYVSWKQGEEIRLVRNEYYWKKDAAYLDGVVFSIIPESATRITGLKTGQINASLQIPIDLAPVVKEISNVTLQVKSPFGLDFMAFNCQKAPFDDVNVRKALNYIFDSKKFVTEIANGLGETGYSGSLPESLWIGDSSLWKDYESKFEPYDYSLEKAKECMASSAHPDGCSGAITTDGDPVRYNAALYLQAAAKEIGIELTINKVSFEQLTADSMAEDRPYDIICNYWGSDFPDPIGVLSSLFLSANCVGGGPNFSNYQNAALDKLLYSQNSMSDEDERAKVFIQALGIIDKDCPWIMIDYAKTTFALSNNMTGYEVTPLWYWDCFTRELQVTK